MPNVSINSKPLVLGKGGVSHEYTAGDGISIENYTISADDTVARMINVATEAANRAQADMNLDAQIQTKQNILTAGTGISIQNDVISATGGGSVTQQSFALTMTPSVTDIVFPNVITGTGKYTYNVTLIFISGNMLLTKNVSTMKVRITQGPQQHTANEMGLALYRVDESAQGMANHRIIKIAQTDSFTCEASMPIVPITSLWDVNGNAVDSLVLDTNHYYYAMIMMHANCNGLAVRGHDCSSVSQLWPFINCIGKAEVDYTLPSEIYVENFDPISSYILVRS